MKYVSETETICVSAGELIEISLRRSLRFYSYESEGGLKRAERALVSSVLSAPQAKELSLDFTAGSYRFSVASLADKLDGDEASLVFELDHSIHKISDEERARARGIAFLTGYMIKELGLAKRPMLTVIWADHDSGEFEKLSERPTEKTLNKFFEKLRMSALSYASAEIEKVSVRMPTMRQMRFPYPSIREGQSDFIESVYGAIRHKRTLYACAPTGTGKTMSVLYPALRAMGEGEVEKIFYLTPKTTTGYAVFDAVHELTGVGAKIRAVQIIAKDRICEMDSVCRADKRSCPYCRVSAARQDEALAMLASMNMPKITYKELRQVANSCGVCPYELSLDYSMMCDIIVCDYNYLFDLRAYLRRYFDLHGNYTFLIDEAHNLLDRARDMYSATLRVEDIERFTDCLPDGRIREKCEKFSSYIKNALTHALKDYTYTDEDGEECAFTAEEHFPPRILDAVAKTEKLLFETLSSKEKMAELTPDTRRLITSYHYELDSFLSKLRLYSDAFKTFIQKDSEGLSIKSVCLDCGEIIRRMTARGTSAVFFSATLQPLNYYKTVFGGERTDNALDIPSPFDTDALSITVMDKIRTSYTARDTSIPEIVEVIFETALAREGNYIVFSPSFSFSDKLFKAFRESYPELRAVRQKRGMNYKEKERFLSHFTDDGESIIGFCVLGGIYSEGIDLVGDSLIGAIIVGVGIPQISNEREALREYYDNKYECGTEYAYTNPGMNRVLQAAGRVIRRESDRGVIVLIDERFSERAYRSTFPEHWRSLKYAGDTEALSALLFDFWSRVDGED